ncbi:hypothetical protein [Hymenobacter sp. HDW8]|uniref:hypothetical protein n=1 Tax=Hymenobacter sp. HDW8 TaxID=2714932 RepID=UPI00140A8859|nr:hypothetical protein [Hymenobacter sp. HDW8]QIL78351.1 hypothetical protein G7064_21285 [Hymenobacter sp. HDW8]
MHRLIGCLLFFLLTSCGVLAQNFQFAGKDAVKVPEVPLKQIRHYVETHDKVSQQPIGKDYPYLPVFNVLKPQQKQFGDGLYYFSWGSHDPGRLFLHQQGTLTFLANGSVKSILADYTAYLNRHRLADTTQLAYLSAIAAFMKFRYEAERILVEGGELIEPR